MLLHGLPMLKTREAIFGSIDPGYSGLRHLLITSLAALSAISCALCFVQRPTGRELLTVPLAFVIANGFEWLLHREVLHRRVSLLSTAYDRHALTHHVAFHHDTMAAPSRREWRWVLFPAPAILGLLALSGALSALLLAVSASSNAALLLFATLVGFYLLYEWLHLSYHQPPDSPVGRLPAIKVLRRHHQLHHHPALARRYNFNITVPLFDLLMQTVAPRSHKTIDSGSQPV
jgi:sterol desaturase/sphingolipid hydroxylase (fatty acid hydroxylase superfamily)